MKQNSIETKAKSQNPQGIGDAFRSGYQSFRQIKLTQSPLLRRGRGEAMKFYGFNIFLIQNKGKGPPGRVRSPGARGHPSETVRPQIKTEFQSVLFALQGELGLSLKAKYTFRHRSLSLSKGNTEYQIVNSYKNQIFNFYKHFNFLIMKKQILILAFLIVAVFAGVNKSYGQGTEISPTPGVEYTYGVTLSVVTSNPTYSWYVVDGTTPPTNLLTATQLAVGDGFFTVNGAANTSTYKLTWTAAAAAKTFYVVIKTTAEGTANGSPCTVENLRTYEVKPVNRFVLTPSLALANGNANTAAEICAPAISSATITIGTPNTVSILYGKTTLYYKIKAEGMLGSWRPSLKLPALGGNGQVYESVKWTPTSTIAFVNFPTAGTLADLTTANGLVANTDFPVAVAGTDYLVEVVIDNQGYETLGNQIIDLSVDGYLPTAYSVSDAKSLLDPTPATPFEKTISYTVKPRPTLTQTVPAFLGKNP